MSEHQQQEHKTSISSTTQEEPLSTDTQQEESPPPKPDMSWFKPETEIEYFWEKKHQTQKDRQGNNK